MTSKITPEAKARCAARTLAGQLEQMRAVHAVELSKLCVHQKHDLQDVEKMLEADMAWSAQHARLAMPIGGAD
jgi:hypothetical protein